MFFDFLTDDVMKHPVDAVNLKNGTGTGIRYTVSGGCLQVERNGGREDSVRCWVGLSHRDTETLTF